MRRFEPLADTCRRSICAFALVLGIAYPALATAQVAPDEAACPTGNLVAGKKPKLWADTYTPMRITDGIAAEEGGYWQSKLTAHMATGGAFFYYDLEQPTSIRALLLQGDNNDTYDISISNDAKSWQTIWTAPMASESGMRTRTTTDIDAVGRYLRVSDGKGDGSYSIGEFQAFCERPAIWPPSMERKKSKHKDPKEVRRLKMARGKLIVGGFGLLVFGLLLLGGPRQEDTRPFETAAAMAVGLGLLGFALYWTWDEGGAWAAGITAIAASLGSVYYLRNDKPWMGYTERVALLCVATAATLAWVNFGTFHGGRAVHYHDSLHYYLGSKYFKENRYTHLYHCAAIAEVEDGRKRFVERRKIRNLTTNALLPADEVLANADDCAERFTDARWAQFQGDVSFFRKEFNPKSWDNLFRDHGYNATPVWNMVGSWLSNRDTGKRNQDQRRAEIERLALIDGALYCGIFLLIGWAFGLRAFTLALLVFGVGYPWAYFWTGGGFGRVPWLFMAAASICLLKKNAPMLGGFALMWSALLRLFPAVLFGGLVVKVVVGLVRTKSLAPAHRRGVIGALAAICILVPMSLPAADGIGAYEDFVHNTKKHTETPLTNHMGLKTLFSYHPSLVARKVVDNRQTDPYRRWKDARKETFRSRIVLYAATVALLFALLGYFSHVSGEDWEAVAMGVVLIVALAELTCYYYNFVILLAPIALRRLRHMVVLVGMAIGTQITQLTVGWFDERYTLATAIVLAAIVYLMVDRVYPELARLVDSRRRRGEPESTGSVATT